MDSFVPVFGCLKGEKGGGEGERIERFRTRFPRGFHAVISLSMKLINELELVELNDRWNPMRMTGESSHARSDDSLLITICLGLAFLTVYTVTGYAIRALERRRVKWIHRCRICVELGRVIDTVILWTKEQFSLHFSHKRVRNGRYIYIKCFWSKFSRL